MIGIVLAIAAALCWSIGAIFIRLGIQGIKASTATFISMLSSLLLVGSLALILNFGDVAQLSPLIRQGVAEMAPTIGGAAVALLSGTLALSIVCLDYYRQGGLVLNKEAHHNCKGSNFMILLRGKVLEIVCRLAMIKIDW